MSDTQPQPQTKVVIVAGQRFSVPALEFVAYSTAGTALPISAA